MLGTDPEIILAPPVQGVSYNQHTPFWKHLVKPAVEEWPDIDTDSQLFTDFTQEAGFRSFSGLEPPSRQFPFSALVLQQHDPAVLAKNTLYRDWKHILERS